MTPAPAARTRSPRPRTRPRSAQLARDVAERDLAPIARHWRRDRGVPRGRPGTRCARPSCSASPSASARAAMGMGDVEAAIVLEELARADVSSAILAQLIFNGPPRAIEHLGNDAMRERWLPLAASGEALFCIGISETEAGSAVSHMRARLHPRRRRLPAQRATRTTSPAATRRAAASCGAGSRAASGHRRASARCSSTSSRTGVTVAGTHVKMGLRGTSEAELAFDDVRVEAERRAAVRATRATASSFKTLICAHQPRAVRERRDVRRRRAGRARVRGAVHERAA